MKVNDVNVNYIYIAEEQESMGPEKLRIEN
jgi:hypothetical protein